MGRVVSVRTNKPKIAVFLVLAGYVSALTLGGWFHSRGRPEGPSVCPRQAARLCRQPPACCSDSQGSPKYRQPIRAAVATDGGTTWKLAGPRCTASRRRVPLEAGLVFRAALGFHDSANCPVCRFLGQKPAPLACGAEAASTPLEEEWTRLRPIPPFQDSIDAPHVRGPPLVA